MTGKLGGALCDPRARGAAQSDLRRRRQPRVLWLHVHYFGAPGGRDLAVQDRSGRGRYDTATRIVGKGVDFDFVRRARQPRAVVRVRGVIRRRADGVLEVTRS